MALQAPHSTPEEVPGRDAGFTLVEVIWALFLLGLIAMAALGLFVHGLANVAHVQRQQAAVSLANSAMDLARSVSGQGTDANGTTGLLRGRNQADVTTTWNAAKSANASDTSDMTITWDKQLGVTTADQWVPVTSTAKVDHQAYTVDTLVGMCWRPKAASSTSQDCIATDPNSTAYIQMYRVRVVVRWDEGSSGTDKHTYRLATLVDPSVDATWNTVLKPFAYDDELYVNAGETSICNGIVLNDTVTYNSGTTDVVKVETSPSYVGTISKSLSGCPAGVYFQAPNKSGLTAFNYHVSSSAGEDSTAATVTVHILPKPVAKTIYVTGATTTDITSLMTNGDPGLTNLDSSRSTKVIPFRSAAYNPFSTPTSPGAAETSTLAGVGISMSGTSVIFDPSKAPAGGTTFSYYLVDSPNSGPAASYHSDTSAVVTIKVDPQPLTPDFSLPGYNVNTSSTYVSNSIDWQSLTKNPSTSKIQITGVTSALGAGTYAANVFLENKAYTSASNNTGSALSFQTNNQSMGTYFIAYKVVGPSGTPSTTSGTITVTVLPLPANYAYPGSITSGSSVDLTAAPIVPTSDVQATAVIPVGSTNCTVSASAPLKVAVTFMTGKTSCQFTYKLVTTNATKYPTPLTSSATGTITVNKK